WSCLAGRWLTAGGRWLPPIYVPSPTTGHRPPTTASIHFNLKFRIERVNHPSGFILDEFSAYFERWGEFPALDRELLIEQCDLLDLLVGRKLPGHFINFLLEVFDNSLTMDQFVIVLGFDTERFRLCPQRVEGRNDQCGGKFSGLADDDRLLDHRYRADHVLDRLRRDVFAQAGLDQVFLAVGDVDEAVGVN